MRAIFLDRDGVICENRSDHVKSWDEFRFIPGALSALTQLTGTEFAVVVITNQAVINRGLVATTVIEDIHARMMTAVHRVGGRIDRVIVCPHRPDEQCDCRKPRPGMITQAAAEMGIDLRQSYLIGDAITDVQAGLAAGCKCTLVLTGRGLQQTALAHQDGTLSFQRAYDLKYAVDTILRLEAAKNYSHAARPAASRATTRPLIISALPGHAS